VRLVFVLRFVFLFLFSFSFSFLCSCLLLLVLVPHSCCARVLSCLFVVPLYLYSPPSTPVTCKLTSTEVATLWKAGGAEADESTRIVMPSIAQVLCGEAPPLAELAPATLGVSSCLCVSCVLCPHGLPGSLTACLSRAVLTWFHVGRMLACVACLSTRCVM